VATPLRLQRLTGERLSLGDQQLEADEVEAGDALGHRVLHLQPGVHLEEPVLAAGAEQELDGRPNMVTLRELAVAADGDPEAPVITVVGPHGQTLARLRTAAVHFEDAATFFPVLGRWEVWQLINLTGDTHPIHIHLEPFHVLARRPITVTVPAAVLPGVPG